MKHQQVVPDYTAMLNSSVTCIMLVACGWVLFRLVQAIILMPSYMAKQERLVHQFSERFVAENDRILNESAEANDEDVSDRENDNKPEELAEREEAEQLAAKNMEPTSLKQKKKK